MKIAAQKITRNPISDSGGLRACKEFQKFVAKHSEHDLGSANGLKLSWAIWIDPVILLRDLSTGNIVGYMELSKADPTWGLKYKYYQAGVFIAPAFRGRKLGTVLYLGALHQFGHLISDPIIGIDAIRTWKSIEKYGYDVKLWDTGTRKTLNFTWASDGQPYVNGQPMSAYESDLLFYV